MIALTTDVGRTLRRIWWHKEANLYYSRQSRQHERMSEWSVNLHKTQDKMVGEKENKYFDWEHMCLVVFCHGPSRQKNAKSKWAW